jgi:hypothetical protein
MGAIVGGIFGGMTGMYYAFQTRSFMYIPMIALTSGGSFGFLMGIGNIMRSEMAPTIDSSEYQILTIVQSVDESGLMLLKSESMLMYREQQM